MVWPSQFENQTLSFESTATPLELITPSILYCLDSFVTGSKLFRAPSPSSVYQTLPFESTLMSYELATLTVPVSPGAIAHAIWDSAGSSFGTTAGYRWNLWVSRSKKKRKLVAV